MRKWMVLSLLFMGVAVVLAGCSDEKVRAKIMAENVRAEAKLSEARSVGAMKWVPDEYNVLVGQFEEIKQLTEQRKYTQAEKGLEVFFSYADDVIIQAATLEETYQMELARKEAARLQALEVAQQKQQEEDRLKQQALLMEKAAEDAEKKRQSMFKAHSVSKGDCLWEIAKQRLGDPMRWRVIYELNKDQINNPNLIYPNQSFKVPAQ